MKNLYAAFVKAQASMDHASKDAKNPHFKSTYSSLLSVIDSVRPALAANGLAFVQKLHQADNGVSVETVIIHESGEEMSCGILFIPATKQDAQGFASACSYAKRYSLQAAVGIASEDDDGQAASKVKAHVVLAPMPGTDIETARSQMVAAPDLSTLQGTFAWHYKAATEAQKPALKAIYDEIKALIPELEPATF